MPREPSIFIFSQVFVIFSILFFVSVSCLAYSGALYCAFLLCFNTELFHSKGLSTVTFPAHRDGLKSLGYPLGLVKP